MTHPQMTDASLLWMTCTGAAYDHHGWDGPSYETWVPFIEAIHNPPLCHDRHVANGTRALYCTGCGTWPPEAAGTR